MGQGDGEPGEPRRNRRTSIQPRGTAEEVGRRRQEEKIKGGGVAQAQPAPPPPHQPPPTLGARESAGGPSGGGVAAVPGGVDILPASTLSGGLHRRRSLWQHPAFSLALETPRL
ncbi:hypothetical protein DPEC_G00235610 [Dallia pectoralis]|uniref:Uncharacterized protein n=1 Tax=Dallia pectoralis TaxID=75939 RepID=A0ACC2FXZ3_DALPE|nr:hypothetical protein DPEC_G00235610 [Dallia pectoralis]